MCILFQVVKLVVTSYFLWMLLAEKADGMYSRPCYFEQRRLMVCTGGHIISCILPSTRLSVEMHTEQKIKLSSGRDMGWR